jgi:UDP-N-acetylmuramate-alanine ligase
MAAIVADLKDLLTAGDVLVTLGAGDIRRLSDELTDHFALSALNRTDTP